MAARWPPQESTLNWECSCRPHHQKDKGNINLIHLCYPFYKIRSTRRTIKISSVNQSTTTLGPINS
uniref:Uncharacterized protein n=1 Tax=Rhizophora mucronata TaxID=61149 RepID=A0A2P2NI42_RHIMU